MKNLHFLGLFFTFTITVVISCKRENITPKNKSTSDVNSQNLEEFSSKIRATGDYIMIAASETGLPSNLYADVAKSGGTVKGKLSEIGIAFAHSDDPDFISKASAIKGIRSVIYDLSMNWLPPGEKNSQAPRATFTPSDSLFQYQWDMLAIHANEAWGEGYKGQGATVAVLDAGFYLNHHDIAPNIDFSTSISVVAGLPLQFQKTGEFSHGTHVAGIVAAALNNYGTVGVAPQAKLMLVRVLTDDLNGSPADVITGIYYAANHGADVINMSFGNYIPHHLQLIINGKPVNFTKENQELLVALNRSTSYAHKKGAVIVAAAGNDHIDLGHFADVDPYPARCVDVLGVSATSPKGWSPGVSTNLDIPTTYTNYGTPEIDFAAPGGDYYPDINNIYDLVLSPASVDADGTEHWLWYGGTSMASPHVAGVAALIVGKHPEYSPAQIEAVLRKCSDDLGKPGRDDFFGYGRVNAAKAVNQ